MVVLTGAALIAGAALRPGPAEAPGRLLAWLLFAGSSVHVASTGWFMGSKEVRKHAVTNDRRGLIGLPLCCVVAGGAAALLVPGRLQGWMLLGFFVWQFHHFQRQNLGLVALAATSAGVARPRGLERKLIMLAGLCGVAGLVADPRLLQLSVYHPLGAVTTIVFAAYVGTLLVGLTVVLLPLRTRRPASCCAMYVMALLFPLPIFVFGSPYAAVSGMTIGHGLQYLVLMGAVAHGGRATGRRRREVVWLCTIALVGGAALSVASHLHVSADAALRGVFGLYVGLVCTHFVVDARLWRLSRPFPRAFLGSRPPIPSPRGRAGSHLRR